MSQTSRPSFLCTYFHIDIPDFSMNSCRRHCCQDREIFSVFVACATWHGHLWKLIPHFSTLFYTFPIFSILFQSFISTLFHTFPHRCRNVQKTPPMLFCFLIHTTLHCWIWQLCTKGFWVDVRYVCGGSYMAIPHYSTFHTTPHNSTQFHIIPHNSTLFYTFPHFSTMLLGKVRGCYF